MICGMEDYKSKFFMGIDIGTHESKGVLIDARCRVISQAVTSHGLYNPKPGWFEHDAEQVWWKDFCILSQSLLEKSKISPDEVGCVSASGLGCDCVPVDETCTPLHNAILYGIDSRAAEETEYLNNLWGTADGEISSPLCSSSIAPKILWFKNHFPEIHRKAHKFLTASSYLTAKLTGCYCMDKYLSASWAPLYVTAGMSINSQYCPTCCRPDQLPELRYATDIVGYMTVDAARETGLKEGTPVLTGTGDSGAEAISAGVFRPGDIMVQLGSTCFFIYYADRVVKDERLWPGPFIVPGSQCVAGGTNTAGLLTQWFRDRIFFDLRQQELQGSENAYSAMAGQIENIPAGSDGIITLPYFSGVRTPINDPMARGVIFGLQLRHTRAHIYKSALEGIGYSICQHFDILKEDELPVNKIVVAGGGTKNPQWLQIIADMLGREIQTPRVTVGAAYGDALLAALSTGAISNWEEMNKVVERDMIFRPNMANHKFYKTLYPVYCELYQKTKDSMHLLCNSTRDCYS